MRGLEGRLLPFNWLKFLVRTHRTQTYRSARIALFGVASKLHGLGGAVVFAMLDALDRKAQSDIFGNAGTLEMSWVLEDNRPVIALMHAFGVTAPSKRYRVYEKRLV